MTRTHGTLLVAALLGVLGGAQEFTPDDTTAQPARNMHTQPAGDASTQSDTRFAWVDVFIDSAGQSLAAYQFELSAAASAFKIVGVEGGEHAAFAEPPFYDPAALQNDRIIIAAFNTGDDLPTGKTRIARIHVQITGVEAPAYALNLTVAAGPNGQEIPAVATFAEGEVQ